MAPATLMMLQTLLDSDRTIPPERCREIRAAIEGHAVDESGGDELLTQKEAAKMLKLGRTAFYHLVQSRIHSQLTPIHLHPSAHPRWSRNAIDELIRLLAQKSAAAPRVL